MFFLRAREAERRYLEETQELTERLQSLEQKQGICGVSEDELVALKMKLAMLQEERENLQLKLKKAEQLLKLISSKHRIRVSKKGNSVVVV